MSRNPTVCLSMGCMRKTCNRGGICGKCLDKEAKEDARRAEKRLREVAEFCDLPIKVER